MKTDYHITRDVLAFAPRAGRFFTCRLPLFTHVGSRGAYLSLPNLSLVQKQHAAGITNLHSLSTPTFVRSRSLPPHSKVTITPTTLTPTGIATAKVGTPIILPRHDRNTNAIYRCSLLPPSSYLSLHLSQNPLTAIKISSSPTSLEIPTNPDRHHHGRHDCRRPRQPLRQSKP
jgi:hypothetical protein